MPTERKEPANITYDGKTIVLTGETFSVSVKVSTSSLTTLYMTGNLHTEAIYKDLQTKIEPQKIEDASTEKEVAEQEPATPKIKRYKKNSKLTRHIGRNYEDDFT
jgi:hypothetical protein